MYVCVGHVSDIPTRMYMYYIVLVSLGANGSARRGRKTITFVDNLREDIGLDDINEIKTMMLDRDVWRDKAKKSRARARHK